jgi:hypothetical protein
MVPTEGSYFPIVSFSDRLATNNWLSYIVFKKFFQRLLVMLQFSDFQRL